MNIRDLKYLVAAARTEHFGQAAERCFVSQPTLSMQLKKFEEELGVQFFERKNKCVMLTPIGKSIAEQAQIILNEVQQLKKIADHAKDPLSGEFHLGLITTVGPYLLPQLFSIIKKKLPKLRLIVSENKTGPLISQLHEGLLDAIIFSPPLPDKYLESHTIFEEPFLLALPKQHALSKKSKIQLKHIDGRELLLLEEGHCLRDQAIEACHLDGVKENAGFKATSLETLCHLVASGAGITLLPQMAAKKIHSKIILKPFSKPIPSRKIGIAWRKHCARKSCCEKILEILHADIPNPKV